MPEITLHHLSPILVQKLQQRADRHGNTIEVEISCILENALNESPEFAGDLVGAIERHFTGFGDFSIPEVPREPIQIDTDLFA